MLQDLQRIRKHNLAVVVNYFLKVQTEKSLIFFLNYLIWVLTNTFRFSCVLHYSCWKISHFLFFLSFLFRMILLVFLMWLSLKNDFLVQFLLYASLVSIFCFSVGNFRQILILFWCQFFFRASPIFFLSCRIYSKILGIIFGSLHLSLHIQCFYKDFWRFNAVITGAIFKAFFKVKGQFNFLKILMKTSGDSCLVPWIFFLLFSNSYVFL